MFTKSNDTDQNNLRCFAKELLRTNHEFKRFLKNEIGYCPQIQRLKAQILTYPIQTENASNRNYYENIIWLFENMEKSWKKWQFDLANQDDRYRALNHHAIENIMETTQEKKAQRLQFLFELQKQRCETEKIKNKESLEDFMKRIITQHQLLSSQFKHQEIVYFWSRQKGQFDLMIENRTYPKSMTN